MCRAVPCRAVPCRVRWSKAGMPFRGSVELQSMEISAWRCVDKCMDMCIDMCMEIRADMCTDICIDMCMDICIDMCMDICIDIMYRHVHGRGDSRVSQINRMDCV